MAPLSEALQVQHIRSLANGTYVYGGQIDREWCVEATPHGGYLLSLIMTACLDVQSRTSHQDLLHLSSHFLQTTDVSYFEVHLTTLRTGKQITNLTAELIQKNEAKIMCHIICGTLPELSDLSDQDERKYSLVPPNPFARRTPMLQHPLALHRSKWPSKMKFGRHIGLIRDRSVHEQAIARALGKVDTQEDHNGLQAGEWFKLVSEPEGSRITPNMIPLFADVTRNAPGLLPEGQRPFGGECWYPTLTLALDFKTKIPKSSIFSPLELGIYSAGRFINEGRHETYAEVWTAPSADLDSSNPKWRESMVCLAVGTQMALTRPISVGKNRRKPTTKL